MLKAASRVLLLAVGMTASVPCIAPALAQPYPGPPPGWYGPHYYWHGHHWHHRVWGWDRWHHHHFWRYY